MSISVTDIDDFELFLEKFLSEIDLLNWFGLNNYLTGVNTDPCVCCTKIKGVLGV